MFSVNYGLKIDRFSMAHEEEEGEEEEEEPDEGSEKNVNKQKVVVCVFRKCLCLESIHYRMDLRYNTLVNEMSDDDF